MGYKKSELRHTSLYDRVEKLLISYEWSDCKFSVCGKYFKAHKLILGISSPVFEAMFYGPLSTNDDIIITDIEPDIFQLLLNYIYTDKTEISSIEQAFELLYASRKYILDHLTEMCISYIQSNISIDNVITVLNYSHYMQDKELLSISLRLFCEHANYLLQENKSLISCSCMKTILESDEMNIHERDLIGHVFDWAINYSEKNNITERFESGHDILIKNGLLKLLRFCILSLKEFEELLTNENNLLLPSESEIIKKAISSRTDEEFDKILSISSSIIPRNSLKLHWYFCHRTPLKSAAPIIIDSNNNMVNLRIKSDKSVFINSLSIPTRLAPILNFRNASNVYSEEFSVSMICESNNSVIKFTNFMNTVEYNSNVDIELSEPCLLKKGKWYKIIFIWPPNRFHTYTYVVQCRDRIYNDSKITIEFDDMSVIAGVDGSFLGGLKYCL